MRSIRRLLAATAAGLALTAASIAVAGPAAATPEDGEGCAGFPDVRATYVCLISATPGNALPSVTTSHIPVKVPEFCYVADCTEETTVNVPVPGATLNDGDLVVLWYQGTEYPVGLALAGQVVPLVQGTLQLVTDTAEDAAEDAGPVVDNAVATVNRTVTNTLGTVQETLDDVPKTGELIALVNRELDEALQTAGPVVETVEREVEDTRELVQRVIENLPTVIENVRQRIAELLEEYERYVEAVRELLEDVPDYREVVRMILENRVVQQVLDLVGTIGEDSACVTLVRILMIVRPGQYACTN